MSGVSGLPLWWCDAMQRANPDGLARSISRLGRGWYYFRAARSRSSAFFLSAKASFLISKFSGREAPLPKGLGEFLVAWDNLGKVLGTLAPTGRPGERLRQAAVPGFGTTAGRLSSPDHDLANEAPARIGADDPGRGHRRSRRVARRRPLGGTEVWTQCAVVMGAGGGRRFRARSRGRRINSLRPIFSPGAFEAPATGVARRRGVTPLHRPALHRFAFR